MSGTETVRPQAPDRPGGAWGRILVPLALALLPAAVLYPLWVCPTSAGEDDLIYYFPLRSMVAEQFRAGQWPLWEPYEATGVRLLADPQSGVFFPPNWLGLVVSAERAYALAVFLAFAVAGLGAYAYLRRRGMGLPAAALGAAVFQFSGFMVGHRVHLAMIQTASLLPWGFWAIEGLRGGGAHSPRRGGRAAGALSVAAVWALMLAAGHWPTALFMAAVFLAYSLARVRPLGRGLLAGAAGVALGSALLAGQLAETAGHLAATTRAQVPYLVAGENSWLPLAGVLAFFPFLMGCRTPNFFPQDWWGPWHLCEMLGYVGLVTLPLSAAAIRRLYRRPVAPAGCDDTGPSAGFVKLWTWMLLAAGVWAMGLYLPTYRLIYSLPVVGKIRCPARALLVVDWALAALAAAAVQALTTAPRGSFVRTLRRWAVAYLPACMAASLALVGALALGQWQNWWDLSAVLAWPDAHSTATPATEGLLGALRPDSPAVWVPLAMAAATCLALLWTLRRPRRRVWLLAALAVADLAVVGRFVDVPGNYRAGPHPRPGPAARWLAENAGDEPCRVWGLSTSYHRRPTELLLPKTSALASVESIAYYGPLGGAGHAGLFGFRPWGVTPHWAALLRRNHLLSLFNVRFLLAAEAEFREVIESVVVAPPAERGPDLLASEGPWTFEGGAARVAPGGPLRLEARYLWVPHWSSAQRPIDLPEGVYRLAVDAAAPQGLAGPLLVEYVADIDTPPLADHPACLRIDPEQLPPGPARHFEWTFQAPPPVPGRGRLRARTLSDRPVELSHLSLRPAGWEVPAPLGEALAPGQRVYVDRTPEGLPPLRPGDPPVHIYENRLCRPRAYEAQPVALPDTHAVTEALRWRPEAFDLSRQVLVAGRADLPARVGYCSVDAAAAGKEAVGANVLGAIPAVGVLPPQVKPSAALQGALLLQVAGLGVFGGLGLWILRTPARRA